MLVAETGYLLTMPERYARIVNRGLPTRIVDFPVPAPPLHVYLYWHENAGPDPGNAWLRALVAEIAQQDHAVEA
jgi:DNA-binding transcriptional LysR family regulator